LDIGLLTAKSAKLSRPAVFHYTADPAELRASAHRVFELLARGVLRATINQRAPLAEAGRVHRHLEGRQTTGTSILLP
jgi:NADPH2:quinone reductase